MKSLITGVCVALLAVASANAADLPPRLPVKGPVYVPFYSWTGFYVGGNLGWGWSDGDGTWNNAAGVGGTFSGSGDGVLGGLQIGYNWQTGSIVFGVEADIQASGAEGDVTGTAGGTTLTATGKNPYFATFRGRLGYAADRWLFYVTGGGVYGKSELDGTLSTTGAFSASETFWTWTLGAGIETAIWTRWTAKLEYLYVAEPDNVPTAPGTTITGGSGSSSVLRVGLNYRF